ncbi:MAG: TrbC/VirB2 family protein [Candidatus Paceibacterota bacterium]
MKKYLGSLSAIVLFFVMTLSVQAATTPSPGNGGNSATPSPGNGAPVSSGSALNIHLNNPLSGISTIPEAINKILSIVIRIALPLIILMFIWTGLQFIFARGNPEKMKVAKNMFFYTVIGTLLILGAWTLTNAIVGTVNNIVN